MLLGRQGRGPGCVLAEREKQPEEIAEFGQVAVIRVNKRF
jgi:hypothetical protein